jgi:hypothetical protein
MPGVLTAQTGTVVNRTENRNRKGVGSWLPKS